MNKNYSDIMKYDYKTIIREYNAYTEIAKIIAFKILKITNFSIKLEFDSATVFFQTAYNLQIPFLQIPVHILTASPNEQEEYIKKQCIYFKNKGINL